MNAVHARCRSFFDSISGMLPVERLFDGVSDIVFFVKDEFGYYMVVNDTLVSRCGLTSKDDALGRSAADLFPSPLGDAFRRQDKEILRSGVGFRDRLELHLYPRGARGWCLTAKEPIYGKNGGIAGICGISRDLQAPETANMDFAAMSVALEYIHLHFDEPLRLPSLSRMAELSVYQFDQRIRSLFHVTAGQYILKVRIDAACRGLIGGSEPIVQIALACGYSDQSSFSRQFKQVVGVSPMEYRRKLKGD